MDPIKEQLKQENTSSQIKDSIRQKIKGSSNSNLPAVSGNRGSIMKQMYDVGNPIQTYNGEKPSLMELESAVNDINKGQKQLEKIKKMQESSVYRGLVQVCDAALELFGRKPTKTDIYELFASQQNNIRKVNYILAEMTDSYGGDVDITRSTLDDRLVTASDESIKRKRLDKESTPELERYEDALTALKDVDREENPDKFYEALQEVINSKRVSRRKRFEYDVNAIGQAHHKEQIDNLMIQEELFETMLYRVMEMAFKTELYQQTLDSNIRLWSGIDQLSVAVSKVSSGINVLAEYNQDINKIYTAAIKDILEITGNHPGRNLINTTNQDMRNLLTDANASAYREASQYE
jgi:hypothetical protein